MQRPTHAHRARTDAPIKEGAPATDRGEEIPDRNSRESADTGRAFTTLCDGLALRGCSLSRSRPDDGPVRFYVGRWGMLRELRDPAAVADFAEQVGARDG